MTPQDVRQILAVEGPIDASPDLPGSKSYTNRALLVAALAAGESHLSGILVADDTEAMLGAIRDLGAGVVGPHRDSDWVEILGLDGGISSRSAEIDARYSGTTARFVLAALATGPGRYTLDGAEALRRRPMADGVGALRDLGLRVDGDALPLVVHGGPGRGGSVRVRGDASSQFLSGLLLAGPCFADGLDIEIDGPLVSRPYVLMTLEVMRAFGAEARWDGERIRVEHTGYVARRYHVEPDASAASYLFATAAIVGGRVRVEGLGSASLQGDLRFVRILESMGATVRQGDDWTEVERAPDDVLHGVEVDMADCSDVAQTLAVVAVFADSPTTITGIGFIRHKETDRIGNVVVELARCGIRATVLPDGIRIHPGTPRPAVVQTYEDHRMAMSFALLGLRAPGIVIADPICVAKTFPHFFDVIEQVTSRAHPLR